jgi:hypothetical protein
MHELDTFMENLIKFNKILLNSNFKLKTDNKEYDKIFKKFHMFKTYYRFKQNNTFDTVKKTVGLADIKCSEKYQSELQTNLKKKKILYIRYASNFLIGIIGSKKFAIKTKNKINGFIKTNLQLQIKKNTIVNKNNKSILFLGFRIKFKTITTKTKKILAEKEAILRYKKRSIAKMTSLNIRIARSFRIALIKSICEAASRKIEPNKTITKKNVDLLAQRILSDIELDKLSENAKSLFFNIKNLKQELNKLNDININRFIEILEALPIPKFKIQESLIGAELCRLKNEFLQNLEKLHHKLDKSFYEKEKKLLFNKRENAVNKIKSRPKSIQKKEWDNIFVKNTIQPTNA